MGIDTLTRAAKAAVASSISELVWYTVAAASTYVFFYVLFRARLRHRRASPRDPVRG